jgi:hypothetical protein
MSPKAMLTVIALQKPGSSTLIEPLRPGVAAVPLGSATLVAIRVGGCSCAP